jgi:uncharacterized membrane protein SirB2
VNRAPEDSGAGGGRDQAPWYCQRRFVLLNLFFVLGPFAIPFLIRSREFSAKEKVFYSAVVLLLTAVLIAALVFMIRFAVSVVRQCL